MSVDTDLVRLLKRLKLGPVLPTLPERLALARAQQLDYVAFLTLLLADEVQRRDQQALERHLLQAGFEDRVALDGLDWTSPVQLDRRQLQQVFTLEFLAPERARRLRRSRRSQRPSKSRAPRSCQAPWPPLRTTLSRLLSSGGPTRKSHGVRF